MGNLHLWRERSAAQQTYFVTSETSLFNSDIAHNMVVNSKGVGMLSWWWTHLIVDGVVSTDPESAAVPNIHINYFIYPYIELFVLSKIYNTL